MEQVCNIYCGDVEAKAIHSARPPPIVVEVALGENGRMVVVDIFEVD